MTLPERYVTSWPPASLVTPGSGDVPVEAWFVRSGDIWMVGYAGQTVHLQDSKGMRYLARLLAAPGREIAALELTSPERSEPSVGFDPMIPLHGGLDVADPVIDAQARTAYEARISELQQLIDEAERDGDLAHAARDREELDAIAEHLVAALGLGGRVRVSTSPSERARQSVTKAVRSALNRIASEHRRLSDHLERTIRTGRYCIYDPEPSLQPPWFVRH